MPAPQDVIKRLSESGQAHLLSFYDSISPEEQKLLLADIGSINLKEINGIFELVSSESAGDVTANWVFTPPHLMTPDPLTGSLQLPTPSENQVCQLVRLNESCPKPVAEIWRQKGLQLIREEKIGVVIMAGGQGTRLGWEGPKGIYPICPISKKSLFQLFCERLRQVATLSVSTPASKSSDTRPLPSVPLYIMTADHNDSETRQFFEKNEYFGLKKSDVKFFQQKMVPCVTKEGKILLQSKFKIARNPNGNGGIFEALEASGMLRDMEERRLSGFHVVGVDNCLLKPADPTFVGFVESTDADVGNKCCVKTDPEEKVGMFCSKQPKANKENRPAVACVVEYSELPEAMRKSLSDSGDSLKFSAGNICNHYFKVPFVKKVVDRGYTRDMYAYHIAQKKIPYCDVDTGLSVNPSSPNGVKVECFIFDCFGFANKVVGLEVGRESDFAPVKNADGPDSPESARELMSNLHKSWVEKDGAQIKGDGYLEVSPLVSYEGEGLKELLAKKFNSQIALPIYISEATI